MFTVLARPINLYVQKVFEMVPTYRPAALTRLQAGHRSGHTALSRVRSGVKRGLGRYEVGREALKLILT